MKILYAIQGTGNGHLSRARDIIPLLLQKAEVDILVSGTEADVLLPFPIKFRLRGLSFVFGKKGGIDLLATYKKSNIKRLYNEIQSLPVEDYDMVINDFEPVSAWACKWKSVPCIGLSHQAAVVHKSSPKPVKADLLGMAILRNYAPVDKQFGFHFQPYAKHIFTPVIRKQIREAIPETGSKYVVYLPAYSDKRIIRVLGEIKGVSWVVFSKHAVEDYQVNNVAIYRIDNDKFVSALLCCKAVLCGAGFETPAEALFLKKKLMVIPMKGQYEQQCNAAALAEMGVAVIKSLKEKHLQKIIDWVTGSHLVEVNYADDTEAIIDRILLFNKTATVKRRILQLGKAPVDYKKFWNLNVRVILKKIAHR